ncbi:hypothetical protein [Spiroplasma helicoides]|nr:hypothetical protein [Spiroplasma helicoides]
MADKVKVLQIQRKKNDDLKIENDIKNFDPIEDVWFDHTSETNVSVELDKTFNVKRKGDTKISLIQNANSHFFRPENESDISFKKNDIGNNQFESLNIVDRRFAKRPSQLPPEILKLRESTYLKEQKLKEEMLDKLNINLKFRDNFKNYRLVNDQQIDFYRRNNEADRRTIEELKKSPINNLKTREEYITPRNLETTKEKANFIENHIKNKSNNSQNKENLKKNTIGSFGEESFWDLDMEEDSEVYNTERTITVPNVDNNVESPKSFIEENDKLTKENVNEKETIEFSEKTVDENVVALKKDDFNNTLTNEKDQNETKFSEELADENFGFNSINNQAIDKILNQTDFKFDENDFNNKTRKGIIDLPQEVLDLQKKEALNDLQKKEVSIEDEQVPTLDPIEDTEQSQKIKTKQSVFDATHSFTIPDEIDANQEIDSIKKEPISPNEYSIPIAINTMDYTLGDQTSDFDRVISEVESSKKTDIKDDIFKENHTGETTELVENIAIKAKKLKKITAQVPKFDDFETWFNNSKQMSKLAKVAKKEKKRMLKNVKTKGRTNEK